MGLRRTKGNLVLKGFSGIVLASIWSMGAVANDCMIGEIRMFAGNFAPRNWAFTDGQLLAITQNQALFSILGTTYGGDGRTTFALPDLRGRSAVHEGSGPGLTAIRLGEKSGQEQVTLSQKQLPKHTHSTTTNLMASGSKADQKDPSGRALAQSNRPVYANGKPTVQMQSDSVLTKIAVSGGSQPVPIRDPYLGVNHIICLQGIYPSRN